MMNRHACFVYSLLICLSLFYSCHNASAADYTLDDLYHLALKQAERIKIAEEEVTVAERGKDRAFSALLPRLTGTSEYRRYNTDEQGANRSTIQPDWNISGGFRVDQSVSLGGREITAVRILKETIARTKLDLRSVQEEYLQRVAAAYYDVFRAQRAVEIAGANVTRLTKYRDAAQARLRVGEVTKTAVLRAEAELSGAISESVRARNALVYTRSFIVRLVPIPGDFTLRYERAVDVGEAPSERKAGNDILIENCKAEDLLCLKAQGLAQRPEVKALEIQQSIAENQVRFVRGGYWPILSGEAVYLRKDETPATGSFVNESAYAGLRVSVPIFEGGLRKAEVGEALARQRQARLALEDMRKTVGVEVENAFLDLKTQAGVMRSLENQAIFATDNYSAVTRQFDAGLASSIDVIDANTLLVTSERQLTDAQFNYQLSILRLRRSTGTLLKIVTAPGHGSR